MYKRRGKVIHRKVGNSVLLGDTSAGYNGNTAATLKGLGNATIEAMIFPGAAPASNNVSLYAESTSASVTRFGLFYAPGGTILVVYRDTESGTSFSFSYTIPKLFVWYHLALTVNATTDELILYVNGVPVASNTVAKGVMTNTNPTSITILRNAGTGQGYALACCYLRVWTSTRTSTEINNNKNKLLSPQANLKVQLRFNESSGNALDSSGNGYNATITGTVSRFRSSSPAKAKVLQR